MKKYRKKPVEVVAFRLPERGDFNLDAFHAWCEAVGFTDFVSDRDETLVIRTLEGEMAAQPGDWIIKGVAGEFYPCKPEIFAATYAEVGDGWLTSPLTEILKDYLKTGYTGVDIDLVLEELAALEARAATDKSEPDGAASLPNVSNADAGEKSVERPRVPEGCKLHAINGGDGWHLSLVDKDDNEVAYLAWPKSWPTTMTSEDLERVGFEIL